MRRFLAWLEPIISGFDYRLHRGSSTAKASEQDWIDILDAVPDQIAIIDSNFRIIRINRAMAGHLETTPASAIGRHCIECIHGARELPPGCPHARTIADGQQHTAIMEESGRNLNVISTPFFDSRRHLKGYVCIARDITEQMRTENELRESENRYRGLFENMMDGFAYCRMIMDDQGKGVDFIYLDVNKAFAVLTGKRDVVGKTVSEVFPGALESNPELLEIYGRVSLNGNPERFELYFKPLAAWLSVSVYSPEPGYFVAIFDDITVRKRAEEALRESQERLRVVFDRAGVGIVEAEGPGRFVAANDRALEILGYSREEFVNMTVHELTHPLDRPLSDALNEELRSGVRDRIAYEKRYLRKDGLPVWVHVTVSAIRDTMGGWVRGIATLEDITERKAAEEALHKAMEELREADRRKDEFLAMLAHELRNPMSTISAAASLLARVDLPPQAKKAGDAMQRQTRQLAKLVDDLLDLSRITRGKVTLEKEDLDVKEVLERALEAAKSEIQQHKHRVILNIIDDPLAVRGDRLRLQQIFTNLLSNAARYMDDGGEIVLSALAAGGSAVIKVTDAGIGIEPGVQSKIFDPFVQIDAGISRAKGGLGIGLAIVRQLTELHGGTVSVHSEGRGKGSTFTVCLPLEKKQIVSPELGKRVAEPGLDILIVDDNQDSAFLIAEIMEGEGHKTSIAFDGETGLRMALDKIPDVILLDIGLPGMDGYEMAREVRKAGLTATLIVAVTGYGQEKDRVSSREAGFDFHLLKPLDYDMVCSLFADWQHSERAEAARNFRMKRSPEHWH